IGGLVDLAPTMADLAGVSPAPEWQGRSLLASDPPHRSYFYASNNEFRLGIREDHWKYIFDVRGGTEELYDLNADPTEQQNVAASNSERCAQLLQRPQSCT